MLSVHLVQIVYVYVRTIPALLGAEPPILVHNKGGEHVSGSLGAI